VSDLLVPYIHIVEIGKWKIKRKYIRLYVRAVGELCQGHKACIASLEVMPEVCRLCPVIII